MCVHMVYVLWCMHVCTWTYVHTLTHEFTCRGQRSPSGTFFYYPLSYFMRQDSPLNLELTSLASLTGQQRSTISLSLLPQYYGYICRLLTFTWVTGIQTWVLGFMWQVFGQLSYLPGFLFRHSLSPMKNRLQPWQCSTCSFCSHTGDG